MEKPKAQKMDGRPLNSIVRIAASFMCSWGTSMKRVVVAKQTHKMNSSIVVNWIGGGVIIPPAEWWGVPSPPYPSAHVIDRARSRTRNFERRLCMHIFIVLGHGQCHGNKAASSRKLESNLRSFVWCWYVHELEEYG